MRAAVLFPLAGFFALQTMSGPPPTAAQSAQFDIAQHGHNVGTASFSIVPAQDGYESTSLVNVKMEGLEYALSKDEQLSATRALKHVEVSATVNGEAVHAVAAPDAAQILLNVSASGRSQTARLDAHAGAVFLSDFDPGALENLLAIGAANNNRDLWAIIPKQAGSMEAVRLATYPDQQGTLDGKPVTVHHLVATMAGGHTDLFCGEDHALLQAELSQAGFALVRKGFVLTPPARPIATPSQ